VICSQRCKRNIPIKIAVVNNGTLGFVEMEMRVEGLLDAFTQLKNPNFARLAEVIGYGGWRVEKADDLEAAVRAWLAHPGPALLDVLTDRMELVMPPKVELSQIFGMSLYSAKAILSGRAGDVIELLDENYLN
jgi:pyruvate dehydrogenase (quinone)